jgi:hypothetical protein
MAKSKCAGRTAKGHIKKGYTVKKGHACPVKRGSGGLSGSRKRRRRSRR